MAEFMTGLKRSCYCGEVRLSDVGKKITVCGWCQRQRDLGQLIFIDLRDRTGILQLAFDESCNRDVFQKAFSVRAEYVLAAVGVVRERTSKNKEIPTGDVELEVQELRVFSKSETPPFAIEENSNVKEDTRLKYRYLDLRRPDMQKKIIGRHRIVKVAHDYYDENGFVEIETPDLIKSTPEGARDYLVPSRMFPGNFFALPQSPQLYKQLLMLSGFDRYMQIARCFRDEDLRADRQPEFTQIDFEMSFVNQEDVMGIAEGFIQKVYREILGIEIPLPLRRMTWQEGMERFGSDKPDLRFGMELTDVSECLKDTEFKVFSGALKTGSVRGINLKGQAQALSRKEIDKLGEWVKSYGAKGLAWTRLAEKETSSFEKFLKAEEVEALRKKMDAQPGDVLFFVADPKNKVVFDTLGALRCELAHRFNLIDDSKPCLLWITDFPLFEYSEEEGRFMAMHHPFTMPNPEDLDKLESDPGSVRALAYDMVLNGNEVGGGSIRINDSELQRRMFKALGFTPEEAQRRFGFLIDAFRFGAPPHGGMAFGLDRLVMLMLNCESIRDVIAFPKVASSAELMSEAPTEVDQKQLNELGIQIAKQK
ncbi:MAG: aspartate--tRNA ligase [Clostridiales bacterium]|jgi:aspartyl-tRNA synthetase|nr:aspartate--tRNA ligase [Clostridiales bacterium]MCI1961542.1 aspartate--tRNA ligase [Clostridiales bacterium]MCI2022049.1 aspartate--tRNA ligase [Clostridiales bacterium]MCI2025936.1 aspartate--tRNA ligase [Clostridiales bacterium]